MSSFYFLLLDVQFKNLHSFTDILHVLTSRNWITSSWCYCSSSMEYQDPIGLNRPCVKMPNLCLSVMYKGQALWHFSLAERNMLGIVDVYYRALSVVSNFLTWASYWKYMVQLLLMLWITTDIPKLMLWWFQILRMMHKLNLVTAAVWLKSLQAWLTMAQGSRSLFIQQVYFGKIDCKCFSTF